MDVKVCDSCGERINGKFFKVYKGNTREFMSLKFGDYPWPRDVHPTVECILDALRGEVE